MPTSESSSHNLQNDITHKSSSCHSMIVHRTDFQDTSYAEPGIVYDVSRERAIDAPAGIFKHCVSLLRVFQAGCPNHLLPVQQRELIVVAAVFLVKAVCLASSSACSLLAIPVSGPINTYKEDLESPDQEYSQAASLTLLSRESSLERVNAECRGTVWSTQHALRTNLCWTASSIFRTPRFPVAGAQAHEAYITSLTVLSQSLESLTSM
ncbi:hypothetical protein EVAR_80940_1 [Eumeta japonica]|uniref:Uncharacterized protein n=1 Tax=Eumeta variegata TaxID=151549 RepID=A0A4C1V1L5_EUMVA|nr:hypothetical protein EVAR_80940_1 [Eumeta japonica]